MFLKMYGVPSFFVVEICPLFSGGRFFNALQTPSFFYLFFLEGVFMFF